MTDAAIVGLTGEILRVGGARLLDQDVGRLEELGVNEAARSLLAAFHAAYGCTTLREMFADPYFVTWADECCSRSDQNALIQQLRVWLGIGVTHSGGVDDPARLVKIERAPTQYVKLLRWAEQYKVIDELHRPAAEIADNKPGLTSGLSLLEAALQPGELQCAARSFLEDKAAAVAGPATRSRLWSRAQPSGTLQLLSTRLREIIGAVPLREIERWSFVATRPVTVDAASGLCRGVLIGEPLVEVELDLSSYEQQALEGSCALCSEACCVHVAVLVARLLDACLDGNDRLSDALTSFACSPSWRRFLEAATRTSPPTHVIPLSFMMEVDGHVLKVGVLRDSGHGEQRSPRKERSTKVAAPVRLSRAKGLDERDSAVVTAMARVARTRGPERVVANVEVLRALAGHGRIEHASDGASIRLVERRLHVSFVSRSGGVVPQVQLAGYPISTRGNGFVFVESPARDAISLKAGGTGLNLTAADYVVHLDPWWNPAAEAQASDRAHRIGQTRPVTIVKLVAEGTIEERMIELQEHKRWLADSVLMADETPPGLAWKLLEALLGESSEHARLPAESDIREELS